MYSFYQVDKTDQNHSIILYKNCFLLLFETWPSGKAAGFGPAIRRFESYRLSLLLMFLPFYCIF